MRVKLTIPEIAVIFLKGSLTAHELAPKEGKNLTKRLEL